MTYWNAHENSTARLPLLVNSSAHSRYPERNAKHGVAMAAIASDWYCFAAESQRAGHYRSSLNGGAVPLSVAIACSCSTDHNMV